MMSERDIRASLVEVMRRLDEYEDRRRGAIHAARSRAWDCAADDPETALRLATEAVELARSYREDRP